MNRRPAVSVCMAAYNGARYIAAQVQSVLAQLAPEDELIVADDASQDDTVPILEGFRDPRVRILRHLQNQGVIKTFESALRQATGEIIFLCDQDDLWREAKVARVLAAFESSPGTTLVLTNAELMDGEGNSLGKTLHSGSRLPLGATANLIRNRYQGSTMAFRREILQAALPFPEDIPMHDSWIGIVNALVGRAVYLPQTLILYRRHGSNATSLRHGPIRRMAAQRWVLLNALLARCRVLMQVRISLRTRQLSAL